MNASTHLSNFYNCPGAWYGNPPNNEHTWGNIVVKPDAVYFAIKFLEKRYKITGTRLVLHPGEDGIAIDYTLRS